MLLVIDSFVFFLLFTFAEHRVAVSDMSGSSPESQLASAAAAAVRLNEQSANGIYINIIGRGRTLSTPELN